MPAFQQFSEQIAESAQTVLSHSGRESFDLAIVLGSGLGSLAEEVESPVSFSYASFPFFPETTVKGHAGLLLTGLFENRHVAVFQGRYHLYEGHDVSTVVLPVRLAHALGCKRLLLTNAAGGINHCFRPGDFMFVEDHINLMGTNPLRGVRKDPFLDATRLYAKRLFPLLAGVLDETEAHLHSGVLAALTGPSYETPAEIRMLRLLGADAVSMSTVPEVIMANYLGMDVAGISLISNLAAGMGEAPLDHADVLKTSCDRGAEFQSLVRRLCSVWQ